MHAAAAERPRYRGPVVDARGNLAGRREADMLDCTLRMVSVDACESRAMVAVIVAPVATSDDRCARSGFTIDVARRCKSPPPAARRDLTHGRGTSRRLGGMSHVVMQAAACGTVAAALRLETELLALKAAYVRYEGEAENPWADDAVPTPLVAFGEQHGVPWYRSRETRFLLKGMFDEEARVLRVDRLVFFWGGGFDLGGPWLRTILGKLGATSCSPAPRLSIDCDDPRARAQELAQFLVDEDYEDQFTLASDDAGLACSQFAIVLQRGDERRYLLFDDSGVQDWAFVSLLPQLVGEDPALVGA